MDDIPRSTRSQTRKKQHRSVRRAKTFSGCMTCRSRHLKCDEERPACRRCLSSQLDCSGYPGYRARLLWRPVRGLSDFEATSRFSDTANAQTPGSVADDHPLPPPHSQSPQPVFQGGYPSRPGTASEQADGRTTSAVQQSEPSSNAHLTRSSSSVPEPAIGLQGPAEPIDADCPDLHLHSSSNCSVQNPTPEPLCISLDHDDQRDVLAHSHLDLLGSLHRQRQLMEHWINHLSDALMPVPGSSNPLKSIFVPIANAGALCPATESSGSVALFYLICSAAAFHLSANAQGPREKSDFMTLALSHHSQGIRHLHHNLASDDPSQQESVLASLLICLTYEPVTVGPSFWLAHLRGAAQWLQSISVADLTRTKSAAILYQTLAGTAIFLRSQIMSQDLAREISARFSFENLPEPYYLHQILGLCKATLKAISDVIATAARLRHRRCDEPGACAEESASKLDRMEMELYLGMPRDLITTATQPVGGDLIRHYSWIFYFASIIYFKRTVRRSPPEEVQSLVEQSLDHIEALGACTSRPFSPFVWPVAIIFLEAQGSILQSRAMVWLDFIIERSTLSIWQRAKPLFCAFWAQRKAPGQADMQWDEFLNDPSNPSIMMV